MTPSPRPEFDPVFVSYNRTGSRAAAEALWRELGDDVVFLDAHDIVDGTDFVDHMVAALLGATVIVLFPHESYFDSPFCMVEWEVAIRAYEVVVRHGGTAAEREAALSHVVVALPSDGPSVVSRLPTPLQRTSWPIAHDTPALAALVRRRLAGGVGYGERIAGLVDTELLQVELDPVLHPPKNLAHVYRRALSALPKSIERRFLGRGEDLSQIHTKLAGRGPGGALGTAVLVGGGGVGKSCLAAEYLHRFGPDHYPGGLFWVNAAITDDDGIGRQLHDVLRAFDKSLPDWKTFRYVHERDVHRELRDRLEGLGYDERVLYVVDGVPESLPNAPPADLARWCPAPSRVSLLVTSRAWPPDSDDRVAVDVVSPTAARALLERAAPTPNALTPEAWDAITEWVGCLPLALQLLRAAVADRSIEPEDLLESIRTAGPAGALDELSEDSAIPGVTDALLSSYRSLSGEGRAAARLLSQLAPTVIPTKLLDALQLTRASRRLLVRRSFVSEVVGDRTLSLFGRMHTVLADVLRNQSDGTEGELRIVCEALTSLMSPVAGRDPMTWPLLNACWPHAAHVYARTTPRGCSPATRDAGLALGTRLAAFLRSTGRLGEAASLSADVASATTTVFGDDDRRTLWAKHALAETRRAQGRLDDAVRLHREVVDAAARCLPSDDREALQFRAGLASALADQGDIPGARAILEHLVASTTRALGPTDLVSLDYQHRLAATLAGDQQFDGAWDIESRVAAAAEGALGPVHPFLLRVNATLAEIAAAQGKLDVARRILEKVVAFDSAILPSDHADPLGYRASLAAMAEMQGDADEAARLRRQVMDTVDAIPGVLEPDVAHILARVQAEAGFALLGKDRLDDACTQLTRALDTSRTTGRNGLRAAIAWNLFVVLGRLNRLDKAERVRAQELVPLVDEVQLDSGQREVRALMAQLTAQ